MKKIFNSSPRALFGIFVSSCLVWLTISPLGSIPDEPAHTIYASAVVRGQFGLTEDWGNVSIPTNIATSSSTTCFAFHPEIPASCQTDLEQESALTNSKLGTTGYPPFYYAIVGLPSLIGFNEVTWYGMRLLSVLLSSLLVGLALFSSRKTFNQHLIPGFLLAFTPMVSYLAASVNPNGLEIVAGITFTFSLTRFWLESPKEDSEARDLRPLLVSASTSAFFLSIVRPYSWLLLIALLFVILLGCAGLTSALKQKQNRKFALATSLGLVLGFVWTLFIRNIQSTLGVEAAMENKSSLNNVLHETVPRLDNYWNSTVGLFGWIDHTGFQPFEQIWISITLLLGIYIIIVGKMRQKLSTAALLFGSVVLAPIGIYLFLFTDGIGYQARYGMALTCSIPVILFAYIKSNKVFVNVVAISTVIPLIVTMTFMGSWIKSLFRYVFGLPLHLPSAGDIEGATFYGPAIIGTIGLISMTIYLILSLTYLQKIPIKPEK